MTATPSGVIVGSVVDMAGVSRAKMMPAERLDAFVSAGAGASTSWMVFCVDDHIAFTDALSAVGDLRLRIDPADLRDLGDGTRWAPADLTCQDGTPWPGCPRAALRSAVDALADIGVEVRVGHELEFTLFDAAGPTPGWSAYGLGSALRRRKFVTDLLAAAGRAGLTVEQVHAEYGTDQFEISLAPADPVTAADNAVLARTLIGGAARAHATTASFSPLPVAGGAGNGAHQHLSLLRGERPLLSDGDGPHGLTPEGGHAVAGLLAALPDATLLLAGSALSHLRLSPDNWAGAYCCWGLENREAAIRLCADTPGNPYGANVEVKPIDPSANPYLVTAVLLRAVHAGIDGRLPLAAEVTVNPSRLTAAERESAGVFRMPTEPADLLRRFADSPLIRTAFTPLLREAVDAVRGYELAEYTHRPVEEVADLLRFAWTI
ncbi:glutamine synthetase [Rhodococcus sp. NPDC003318]|uniref:glutamine synthetase n=1 Tax=Rhodococcus sp. NPDC003318 TaxID=3364503 RepID=UPI00369EBAD1